jgi:hypothetical protein
VFNGRHKFKAWAISANELREMWRQCVSNAYGVFVPEAEMSASIDVQRLKKSAYRYLGKYLSKGCGIIAEVVLRHGERVIPSSWAVCTHDLKQWVEESTLRLNSASALRLMDAVCFEDSDLCTYSKHLYHEFFDGGKSWIALYGELTEAGVTFATALRFGCG